MIILPRGYAALNRWCLMHRRSENYTPEKMMSSEF